MCLTQAVVVLVWSVTQPLMGLCIHGDEKGLWCSVVMRGGGDDGGGGGGGEVLQPDAR